MTTNAVNTPNAVSLSSTATLIAKATETPLCSCHGYMVSDAHHANGADGDHVDEDS